VIDERTTVTCPGYFTGCGTGKPKCLDKGTFRFTDAVAHSDNSYFSTVYKSFLDQPRYHGADSALSVFNSYAATLLDWATGWVWIFLLKKGINPYSSYYSQDIRAKMVFMQCYLQCHRPG
jgi:penicillin-binding protein 2